MEHPSDQEHSLDHRIARHLGAHSSVLPLTETPISAIERRARARRTHRRTTVGALTALAVTAGTVAVIDSLSRNDDGTITAATSPSIEPSAETAAGAAAPVPGLVTARLIESDLVWNEVVPAAAEALGSSSPSSNREAPFLQTSTAPGITDWAGPPVLYRSDDGIHWQPGTELKPNTYVDEYSGALNVFNSGGATIDMPVGSVVIESSLDAGATWQTQPLPVQPPDLSQARGVAAAWFSIEHVVSGPTGTLAIGQQRVNLDPTELGLADGTVITHVDETGIELVPSCIVDEIKGVPLDAPGVTTTTTTPPSAEAAPVTTVMVDDGGATALTTSPPTSAVGADSNPPCPGSEEGERGVRSWADLGLDAAVVQALNAPPQAFFEPAGGDAFTEVTFPDLPGDRLVDPTQLVATTNGFAMLATSTGATLLLQTSDGSTWSQGPAPLAVPDQVGQLPDGTLVVTGLSDPAERGSFAVATSADAGVTWTVVDLRAIAPSGDAPWTSIERASITDSGIALVVYAPTANDGTRRFVLHSTNGLDWSSETLQDIAGRPMGWTLRLDSVGGQLLLSVTDPSGEMDPDAAPSVRTVVLVGTPTS